MEHRIDNSSFVLGFHSVSFISRPGSCLIREDQYSKIEGPLSPEWRCIDSIWGLVDEQELQDAISKVKKMKNDGSLQKYFEDADATRRRIGQSITIFAQKPCSTSKPDAPSGAPNGV